jgi:hypothetical protein
MAPECLHQEKRGAGGKGDMERLAGLGGPQKMLFTSSAGSGGRLAGPGR